MNSQELLASMRNEVARVQNSGQQGVTLDGLDNYLARLQVVVSSGSEQQTPEKIKIEHDFSLELFRSFIAAGQSVLKIAMTMNGGAAVAMLALLGSAASNSLTKPLVSKLALPLFLFVLGVLSSGVATGVNYLTAASYSNQYRKTGHMANGACIILVFISYLAFAYASYAAYQVFAHF